ncbi:MAG: hypothetical protein Q7K65_04145 [Candidatus Buchananbacteria bacterium]|nr:hypothetical protein [Candidatus Buchananbacteria bacterium]
MIQKIRQIIIYLVRNFFLATRNIKLCRYFGIGLYKIGLHYAVKKLAKIPETEAIYSSTDFNDEDFLPGESDIDLVVVLKKETAPDIIFDLNQILNKAKNGINFYFPFFQDIFLFDAQEFYDICHRSERIEHEKKDFDNLILIWGEDKRKNLTPGRQEAAPSKRTARIVLMVFMLLVIENHWGQKNLRRVRKFFGHILYLGFHFKYHRKAKSVQDYLVYMAEIGVPAQFIDIFPKLKEFDFDYQYELLPLMVYSVIKIYESIDKFEKIKNDYTTEISDNFTKKPSQELLDFFESVDKKMIKSIYALSSPYFRNCVNWQQNIYIILNDDIGYGDFKIFFDSFFENLTLLELFPIRSNPLARIFRKKMPALPSIYFLTDKTFKSPHFFRENEAGELDLFGYKIFGDNIDFSAASNRFVGKLFENENNMGCYSRASEFLSFDDEIIDAITKAVKFFRIAEEKRLFFYGDIDKKYKEIYGEDGPDINDKKDIYRFFYEHAIKNRFK